MPAILSTLLSPLSLLTLSLPSLIISESTTFYPGSAIFKILASTAFVWRSLEPSTSLLPSILNAKWWITFSLISGLIGDFCLIPSHKSYHNPSGGHEGDSLWFKVGMLAFMINHAGYIGAFLQFVKGDVVSNMDWKIFGGVFVTCIILGDLCGMPVPWREDTPLPRHDGSEGRNARSGSPRLPTTAADAKLKISELPSAIEQTRSYRKGTRHTRSDSGVTDLSISIPSTPKDGSKTNSPTTSTPLLHSSSTSSPGGLIPKMAIPSDMKPLIIIYQLIITTMVASAAGTRGLLSERLLGAFMFMVSDVMVAWDTFGIKPSQPVTATTTEEKRWKGRQGWKSRGVGWILYFGGQYILAVYGAN
ncbi:hypothetical protein TWF281_003853 [Arthrobotrys megalospora]